MNPINDMINKLKNANRNNLALIGAIILLLALLLIIIVPFRFTGQQFQTSENDTKLSEQIESEKSQLLDTFNQRFTFLKDNYSINKTVLLGDGDYAAIILTMDSVTYRSVLNKEANGWKVRGLPSVVLFYEDYNDVPREVIKAINDLEAY